MRCEDCLFYDICEERILCSDFCHWNEEYRNADNDYVPDRSEYREEWFEYMRHWEGYEE